MKGSLKHFLVVILPLTLLSKTLNAQTWQENEFGATVGLNIALGTHINRLGITMNGYYISDRVQLNLGVLGYHNFKNLGPSGGSSELKLSLGTVVGFGEKFSYLNNEFLSPVGNQTTFDYAVGYAYMWYLAGNSSSQRSGMIGVHIDQFFIAHENDILSGTGQDRFRTGGLMLSYTDDEWRFGLNYMGWTGDAKSNGVEKHPNIAKPNKKGFKDLRNGTHGRFSHGISALQVDRVLDYGQVARLQAGIDAEQIRHAMQNQLIHDWVTNGYKYPMLSPDGAPYIFEDGKTIRPAKPYFEGMLNPALFY